VSRKFVYQQTHKARIALDHAFSSAAADDDVLFKVKVTKRWLRQAIVALALMCRGSYVGIIEFMRDLLGISISISWLRVSGTTEMPQIDHCVRHQFHTVVPLLFERKAQQQPLEFVFPCEGPLHA